ncbi:MAG: TonB-dependent receptor plug domain-containing protein, partial [Gemmatimonadaceae bacterium]
MSTSQVRHIVYAVLAPIMLMTIGVSVAVAQSTTITGRVTGEGGAALPDTRVTLVGTNLITGTNATGQYTLRNVPAGAATVRVIRVGYQEQKKGVMVTTGQSATLDFQLTATSVQLSAVVTTATGEQRRVEQGNAISTINAAQRAQQAPVTDLASLVAAQAPGVVVEPGNTTGTGANIRIRGTNSLSLVNDPIYIIDGVRMTSSNGSISGNIFTGGAAQSRAQDINPDEIESIEIVKGPSAATLYGTDAANGVIVITTKRGHAGDTRYSVFGETGLIQDRNQYPTAYTIFAHAPAGSTTNCSKASVTSVSTGACIQDSLSKFNLFENPNTTPLGNGYRRNAGLQIQGGSEIVRFFTSGEYTHETGIFKIPNFDIQRLDTLGIAILPEWRTPNDLARGSARANVTISPSPKFDAQVSTNYITLRSRLPQSDNNAFGVLSNGFGGPGYENNGLSSIGFPLHGYSRDTPAESFQDVSTQFINRYIGSTNLTYRPASWLSARADGGLDYTARTDQQLCRRGNCGNIGTARLGFATDDRASIRTTTVNGVATATFNPRRWLNSRTSLGTQWVSNAFYRNGAQGLTLPPGATTVDAGATQLVTSDHNDSKTFGVFIEQLFGIRDRVFLTGALRSDQNSAFGTN